jgi:2-polyprenyl-3-methyl-5-hydroxy-6-metoxy-1,4-benzoquinol methylase
MSLRWRLRNFLTPYLRSVYEKLVIPPAPNDIGTRDVEYSFIASRMPKGPGIAIDFGCGNSWMPLLAARNGFFVTGIDVREPIWSFKHNSLLYENKDIGFIATGTLDLVVNCSVMEHIGLGRYGVEEDQDEDFRVMDNLRGLLAPSGIMLFTTQVGRDKIIPGVHRLYGKDRLRSILSSFVVLKEEFWIKKGSKWEETGSSEAFDVDGNENYYALGLFVLGK